MSLADELTKLEELRRSGALTDAEFAQAKAAILTGGAAAPSNVAADKLGEQLAEVRYQNELARLDREWGIEKEKYMVSDKHGRRHIPTTSMGTSVAAIGGIGGLLWTISAFTLTSSGPDEGAFGTAKVIFPLFGVLFIVVAIGFGFHTISKASAYNQALAAYQRRRAAVKPEDFR
jgi:hypothetical protein